MGSVISRTDACPGSDKYEFGDGVQKIDRGDSPFGDVDNVDGGEPAGASGAEESRLRRDAIGPSGESESGANHGSENTDCFDEPPLQFQARDRFERADVDQRPDPGHEVEQGLHGGQALSGKDE